MLEAMACVSIALIAGVICVTVSKIRRKEAARRHALAFWRRALTGNSYLAGYTININRRSK